MSTQGFLTENAIDLAYLAKSTAGKVAILTDYDISGIVIAHQVLEVLRIGIDKETLQDSHILDKKGDLEEYYTPNPSHLKAVEDDPDGDFLDLDIDLDYLRNKRIEINAVMKEVGRERFWEWIIFKLENEFGNDMNYNRAIDIPQAHEFVPDELRTFNTLVISKIRDVLKPEQDDKLEELAHYNATIEGMIEDVSKYEDGLREEFQDIVDERANVEVT